MLADHSALDFDLLARVGLAALLGVVIGLERQWRERMAGLQTMALVSMGSALFVVFGAYGFSSGDPTRVAAQIVSGIGFLGAGVIIKQGASVTGLNTAATLWATAAVGSLAGAWMWREAVAGALVIFFGNLGLHALGGVIDSRTKETLSQPSPRAVEIACSTDAEGDVRRALLAATRRSRVRLVAMTRVGDAEGPQLMVRAEYEVRGPGDTLSRVSRRLSGDRRVTSIRWIENDH